MPPGALYGAEALARGPHGLGGLEARHQRQQAQAGAIAVHPHGVDQRLAEHLQSTADSEHTATACRMRSNRRVQPLCAQPGQVSRRGLAAGQDDPVGALHIRWAARPGQTHTRHIFERLEFVQIADARIRHHGDARMHGTRGGGAHVEHAVLLGQAVVPLHRNGGDDGHAGLVLQHLRRWRQQCLVAPELVEHEASDERAFFLGQQRPCAKQVGKGATAVDIRHQQAARLSMARHAHVDHVAGVQIDLCRRARAFDDHHVVLCPQCVQRRRDLRPHTLAAAAPWQLRKLIAHLSQQHHLALRVRFGLEQQRVHAHVGHGPRCQRLEILGTANLAELLARCSHHARVVAHVLRLERRHLQALVAVVAAQRGGQPALARAAGGAQHHDAARRPGSGLVHCDSL